MGQSGSGRKRGYGWAYVERAPMVVNFCQYGGRRSCGMELRSVWPVSAHHLHE